MKKMKDMKEKEDFFEFVMLPFLFSCFHVFLLKTSFICLKFITRRVLDMRRTPR